MGRFKDLDIELNEETGGDVQLIGSKQDLVNKWKRDLEQLKKSFKNSSSTLSMRMLSGQIVALEKCITELSALFETREELINRRDENERLPL